MVLNQIAQFESDLRQIDLNYFCTDQTNINQTITTRNFYDSAVIDVFIPGTDTVIGKQLYASVNSQGTSDFSKIIQNVTTTLSINYDDIIGTINFNYTVVDSEFIKIPVTSKVTSVSGIFTNPNINVYIKQSTSNPNRVLYTLYASC
jgi:hypothetical protein